MREHRATSTANAGEASAHFPKDGGVLTGKQLVVGGGEFETKRGRVRGECDIGKPLRVSSCFCRFYTTP